MFEYTRRGRQATGNFTTNVPKILDLKSSTEQIFSENWRIKAYIRSLWRRLDFKMLNQEYKGEVLFCSKFLFSVLVKGTTQEGTVKMPRSIRRTWWTASCLKMAVLTSMKPKHWPTTAPKVQAFCGLPPTNLVTCSAWIIQVTGMPLCTHTTQIFTIQEPIKWSLHLPYKSLESTLSRVDL